MAYSPLSEFLIIFFTTLIIIFSIGALLYIEKLHWYGIEDMATPIIVSQPEIVAVPVEEISPINVK